ncbi:glycosyltransferase family 4 protein [Chrysiogenes arsenatis]|uniref:glycosyltransferase family 4 protein n=1 Tax=Chrysiogenes arsenatis TaxID=309797 RepID=UPI000406B146|nr:glycosyltransferase [Chrysiogenes arsenatis]
MYFIVFGVALIFCLVFIAFAQKQMLFIDSHDSAKPQRFHETPTPRIGGAAIFLATLALALVPQGEMWILAAAPAFAIGLFEDLSGRVPPKVRLLFMVGASLLAIWLMDAVVNYLGFGIDLPYVLAILFTVFAVVGVINAINIIDGFNGLASGVSLLAFCALGFVAWQVGDGDLVQINSILAAAVLGFMVLNFPFGKIFLGDGGAYFLGFCLAIGAIMLVVRNPEVSPWFPFALLIHPVWEVVFSMYRRRMVKGKASMDPDALHLHTIIHRRITRSNPVTTVYMWIFVAPFMFMAVFLYAHTVWLALLVVGFCTCYMALYHRIIRFQNPPAATPLRKRRKRLRH